MKFNLYGAPWCANCNQTKDQLKALGLQEGSDFVYINVDNQPEAVAEHGIRGLPTLIDTNGGRAVGLVKILEFVKNEHLSSN